MKLIETADGTVQVIELDLTKAHLLIVEDDALYAPVPPLTDGTIIVRRRGSGITLVEGERASIEATAVRSGG